MVVHDVALRGLRIDSIATGATPGATILKRVDEEFIPAVLQELGTEELRQRLARTVMPHASGSLKLFQPVHRTFHLGLFEVACETLGTPRVDAAKIHSTGLVVRRLPRRGNNGTNSSVEGWMQSDHVIAGWTPLSTADELRDPDPTLRPASVELGHPALNRALASRLPRPAETAESISPLFVAPPDVCAATKRTVLYGTVPVTSTARAESQQPSIAQGQDGALTVEDVIKTLPSFLQVPSSGAKRGELESCLIGIGAVITPERAEGVLRVLDELVGVPGQGPVGPIIREGVRRMGLRKPSGLPAVLDWQTVNDQQFPARVAEAVRIVIQQTAADVAPANGRFDEAGREYHLRAFVRIEGDEGCPPTLVWGEPSVPYTIAQWYESGDVPPARVTLPDVTDLDTLKNLKPNVAFVTPGKVFDPLAGVAMDDLLDGKKSDLDFGLDWICGFSIPILTLCALIVLSIFLGLLNFIFRWLAFVKICIPFPKPQPPSS